MLFVQYTNKEGVHSAPVFNTHLTFKKILNLSNLPAKLTQTDKLKIQIF